MPQIKQAGKYQVYVYVPKVSHSATITQVQIFDGQNTTTKTINKKDVQVVGQTSGEWVAMGISQFSVGKKAYVQLSNQGADGAIVADAVLLVAVDNK